MSAQHRKAFLRPTPEDHRCIEPGCPGRICPQKKTDSAAGIWACNRCLEPYLKPPHTKRTYTRRIKEPEYRPTRRSVADTLGISVAQVDAILGRMKYLFRHGALAVSPNTLSIERRLLRKAKRAGQALLDFHLQRFDAATNGIAQHRQEQYLRWIDIRLKRLPNPKSKREVARSHRLTGENYVIWNLGYLLRYPNGRHAGQPQFGVIADLFALAGRHLPASMAKDRYAAISHNPRILDRRFIDILRPPSLVPLVQLSPLHEHAYNLVTKSMTR